MRLHSAKDKKCTILLVSLDVHRKRIGSYHPDINRSQMPEYKVRPASDYDPPPPTTPEIHAENAMMEYYLRTRDMFHILKRKREVEVRREY